MPCQDRNLLVLTDWKGHLFKTEGAVVTKELRDVLQVRLALLVFSCV
jgi:hypothetical protein